MASLEITAEELSGIDTNQVAQMTLKEGTVIVINGGAEAQEAQAEEEFFQEEQSQEVQAQEELAQEDKVGKTLSIYIWFISNISFCYINHSAS